MTVLFAGSEREAEIQGAGSYTEDTNGTYRRSAYSRAAAVILGSTGDYTCPFQTASDEVFLNWRTAADQFGENNGVRAELRDASNNVLVRVSFTGQVPTAQYWNGSEFVNATGVAPVESNVVLTQYSLHVKKGAAGTGLVELFVDGILKQTTGAIDLTSYGDMANAKFYYSGARRRSYVEVVATDGESTQDWGVLTVPPSANGTDTDGTGAASDVNEVVMNTATYLAFDTAAQKRSFVHTAITVENFVRGVTVSACARRVDGTGPQQMRPYVIVGGVRYYGTTFALTTSFTDYQYVWSQNPATLTDWTTSDVNDTNFQMGWEAVA